MIQKNILEELYLKKRMSSVAIAKKFGIKHDRTVRKWMEKYNIPRRTLSEAKTKYPKTSFNGNGDLKAYMLGLRAGDFHARRIHKIIRVQTTTTHPAQVEMMENVFGKFSHVGKHLFFNKHFNLNQWFIYCDLNESFSFILEKPNDIPKWILKDTNLFFNFVAGYADSEGSWKILKSHENSIRFVFQLSSQDKKILNQITKKLRKLGYEVNIYLDTKAGIKKNNLDLYRILIYQTEDVSKLARILLPISCHQEKIDKINLILKSKGKKWNQVEEELVKLRNKIKNSRLQNA